MPVRGRVRFMKRLAPVMLLRDPSRPVDPADLRAVPARRLPHLQQHRVPHRRSRLQIARAPTRIARAIWLRDSLVGGRWRRWRVRWPGRVPRALSRPPGRFAVIVVGDRTIDLRASRKDVRLRCGISAAQGGGHCESPTRCLPPCLRVHGRSRHPHRGSRSDIGRQRREYLSTLRLPRPGGEDDSVRWSLRDHHVRWSR